MDWTEKYRPQSLDDVIGNPGAVSTLRTWAKSWEDGIPDRRALVLIGTPGIGKTTSAHALAREMGWALVEMNSSDQRDAESIMDVAVRGSRFNTFSDDGSYLDSSKGQRKLIVLDEADSFFGNADRGAIPVITRLIKETQQPLVLIVNDFYELSRKCSAAKTDTVQITFQRPKAPSVVKALARIAQAEGIEADPGVLDVIAERAGGDMRAAVRNLESLSLGQTRITAEMAEGLSYRDKRNDMYSLMSAIFRSDDAMKARELIRSVDTDPPEVEVWVDENLPYEFPDKGDLVRGYERLSRADIFLGRVSKRQYFGFWSYASDMLTAGVNTARMSSRYSHDRLHFPSFLSKMSRSKTVRALRRSVDMKVAAYLHTSTRRADLDVLPYLRQIAASDPEMCMRLAADLQLEPEELAFLIDRKPDSKEVKAVYSAIAGRAEAKVTERRTEKAPPAKAEPADAKPAEAKRKNQASLFDF